MSGLKGITTNTAAEEAAHIYAEDDAAVYAAIVGNDGVFNIGQKCAATVLSNNKVRVADGVICIGGHFARIPYGSYEDVEIANGQSGYNRNDIIVGTFVTTGNAGIDTMKVEVKKGTVGTTATDPEVIQGDVYSTGKKRELPLYRVKLEGINIVAVEQLFTLRKTTKELEDELNELNSNKKTFFRNSGSASPSFSLDFLEDNITYMYIISSSSDINSSSNAQETSCYLNGTYMGKSGNYCTLTATFTGLCKKGDIIKITHYKNGGNWISTNTRLSLIPVDNQ